MFNGTYSEYKAARQVESAQKMVAEPVSAQPRPAQARPAAASLSKMEQRKRQQRLAALEDEISRLEQELALVARQLETPSSDLAHIRRLGQEYTRLHTTLEDRMEEWGALNP